MKINPLISFTSVIATIAACATLTQSANAQLNSGEWVEIVGEWNTSGNNTTNKWAIHNNSSTGWSFVGFTFDLQLSAAGVVIDTATSGLGTNGTFQTVSSSNANSFGFTHWNGTTATPLSGFVVPTISPTTDNTTVGTTNAAVSSALLSADQASVLSMSFLSGQFMPGEAFGFIADFDYTEPNYNDKTVTKARANGTTFRANFQNGSRTIQLDYTFSESGGGGSHPFNVYSNTVVVPEPSSLLLSGLGLASFLLIRKRA